MIISIRSTEGCLQAALDNYCLNLVKPACTNFPFARFNTEKGKWRCYENLSGTNTKKNCANDAGERVSCGVEGTYLGRLFLRRFCIIYVHFRIFIENQL